MRRLREENPNTLEHMEQTIANGFLEVNWAYRTSKESLDAVCDGLSVIGSLLDVGAGSGRVTRRVMWRRPGLRVSAVDFSPPVVAWLKERLPTAQVQPVDARQPLPFETGQFDDVICTELLEHMDDPEALARELCRVARKSVTVSVPDGDNGSGEHVWDINANDLLRMFTPYGTTWVTLTPEGLVAKCTF